MLKSVDLFISLLIYIGFNKEEKMREMGEEIWRMLWTIQFKR